MLQVKTKLGFSDLHGIGVFADEPIAKGRMVIRHHSDFDLKFTETEMLTLPAPMREAIEYYGTHHKKADCYFFYVDNERFLNHSAEPNLRSGTTVMFAARDIEAGEELTVDYRQFCDACIDEGVEHIFRQGPAFTEGDTIREK